MKASQTINEVIGADSFDRIASKFYALVEDHDQVVPVLFYVTATQADLVLIEGAVVPGLNSLNQIGIRGGVFCCEVWIEHTRPDGQAESLDSAVAIISFDSNGFDLVLRPFSRSAGTVTWTDPGRPALEDFVFDDVLAALRDLVA